MAPIKLENNIKETLEKRTITPSSKSWESLSNRLDSHENKKNNNIIWYLGVAASIVGILFLMNGLFFNPTIPIENTPNVVNSDELDSKNTVDIAVGESDENLQEQQKAVGVENFKSAIESNGELVSQHTATSNRQQDPAVSVKSNQTINQNNKVAALKNDHKKPINDIESNGLEEEAIEGRMAINDQQDIIDATILDSEIETLLSEAQLQIDAESVKRSVDANSLLQDVEDDLEQSFRDKVFETIKTNFKKVKTAVADRNN
ncbi:hypothetical protein C1T31_06145 [Hanstruepera neustonica]|uniref:Uncharacterized protein n=1 Tax=Hanstruepera neustonica TaxID=1445657 RepID=A0A2K1E0V2_9FLAO|nr:hypothetical protein [Hanstruepera neustonica]PNQ73903.1 hypothetical protein C1T31_06145 [Hanstruepera neustonica]